MTLTAVKTQQPEYDYDFFRYKQGDHGFVYVLSGGEWVRSGMTWEEIKKRGVRVK